MKTIGLDRASFNQGYNALYDFLYLEEVQPTLTSRGPGGVAILMTESSEHWHTMTTKGQTDNMLIKENL